MKGPLFHWGLVLRYVVYGALPLVGAFWMCEVMLGDAGLGVAVVVLAAILPFYAIGWLGYQHWKHAAQSRISKRKFRIDEESGPDLKVDLPGQ